MVDVEANRDESELPVVDVRRNAEAGLIDVIDFALTHDRVQTLQRFPAFARIVVRFFELDADDRDSLARQCWNAEIERTRVPSRVPKALPLEEVGPWQENAIRCLEDGEP